jgi:hypothetical protein
LSFRTLLRHRFYALILQQCLIALQCYINIKLICSSNIWFLITPNHLTTPLTILKFQLQQCSSPPTNDNNKVWVVARFRVFGGMELGSYLKNR